MEVVSPTAMAVDTRSPRVLVTGGAGFIGGSVSIALAMHEPGFDVTAFDNLKRRGSELNLPRLRAAGVRFVHGDVRELPDLLDLDQHDVLIECSAEPSVLAGIADTSYLFDTNLKGAYNCLELARRDKAQIIFLSTSRVYPVAHLNSIRLLETESRFEITSDQDLAGVSAAGISENFPLDGARTLYGTTKLSAEMLVAEYRESYNLCAAINRCGVITGPWQMGKVDQGVFTHWLLSHYLKKPLNYIGYGGEGKQVRDLLHVDDLVDLVVDQIEHRDRWNGVTVNVGGGLEGSLSLKETTQICKELTGNQVKIDSVTENRPGDVPIYISDCSALEAVTDWRPGKSPREIIKDVYTWVREHESSLKDALQ